MWSSSGLITIVVMTLLLEVFYLSIPNLVMIFVIVAIIQQFQLDLVKARQGAILNLLSSHSARTESASS